MVRRKRDNGDGSLFLSHGRWRGYLSLDTGRRKYFNGCSRAEVQKKLREARRALEQGDESCLRLHVVPSSLGKR